MDEGTVIIASIISIAIGLVIFVSFLNLCARVRLLLDLATSLEAHMAEQTRYLAAISVNIAKSAGGQKQPSKDEE